MGLFTPKKQVNQSTSPQFVGGPRGKNHKTEPKEEPVVENEDPEEEESEDGHKKAYDEEKAVYVKNVTDNDEPKTEVEAETEANTRKNALLYHTSEDTVDMYRLENSSLDLLGRMYYDDYDASDIGSVERVSSYTSLLHLSIPSIAQVTGSSTSLKLRPLFERGVSFDTMDDTHHQSITLKVKHPEFKFRRNNKTYLIGFSDDSESVRAVEWAFQEMVIHGDTIVVLQVLDEKMHLCVDPERANTVLAKLESLNTYNRRISMVYEVVVGKPQKLLKLAIEEYKPAMMVVGTHQYGPAAAGLGHHFPFMAKTSVSKYFLMFALVPVILVKPFYQHHGLLENPIDLETYFQDWLGSIDVSHTREKKRGRFGFISPSASRSASTTNLAALEDRGRGKKKFTIGSRDSSPLVEQHVPGLRVENGERGRVAEKRTEERNGEKNGEKQNGPEVQSKTDQHGRTGSQARSQSHSRTLSQTRTHSHFHSYSQPLSRSQSQTRDSLPQNGLSALAQRSESRSGRSHRLSRLFS